MCFLKDLVGPSASEKKAAADARIAASAAKRAEQEKISRAKATDISEALTASTAKRLSGGGNSGRTSLFSSTTGSGFMGRFD